MKSLVRLSLDPVRCRAELADFRDLLAKRATLNERDDILPFFKARHHLSLLIGTYFPTMSTSDCYAHEYQIDGDFAADLVVGNFDKAEFVLVEFENGRSDSIFKKVGSKATPNWAPRLEVAYSQITDWLWKLEDKRSTADFVHDFGNRQATFRGLIIIGKDVILDTREKHRLKWRMDHTLINSIAISVRTFDELRDDLDHWLTTYYGV